MMMKNLLLTIGLAVGIYDSQGHVHDTKEAFENLARIGREELVRMRKAKAEAPTEPAKQDLSFLRDIKFD